VKPAVEIKTLKVAAFSVKDRLSLLGGRSTVLPYWQKNWRWGKHISLKFL